VEGIDLIVGGHSHTLMENPLLEGDTLIVQAGAQTSHLGQLELAYHRETGQLRVRNEENNQPFVIAIDDRFEHHPLVAERVAFYTEQLNDFVSTMTNGRFTDVLGTIAQSSFILTNKPPLQETPVGNFITDGMRLMTEEITGRKVDVAIQANGSIRGSMVPRMGDGTYGELSFYDVTNTIGLGYGQDGYPGYSVASVYLTGEELRRVLEVASLLQELMGDNYFLQFSGLSYSYNPRNTVLLTIPVMDQPIPTTRAITEAYLYRGEGIQPVGEGDFIPLNRGDENLYHLVTDTYILSFLPLAGEMLPQLEIVPKNQQGEPVPIDRLHELTVMHHDRELKVWETAALYAASLPAAMKTSR
jgi:5'-nucleotidase / UDP-sugar diphosphatase